MAEKKKKASNSSMRLDKFLVEMGKGSRSQIKEMAKKGRIQVNGTVKGNGWKNRSGKRCGLTGRTAGFLCTHRIFYVK